MSTKLTSSGQNRQARRAGVRAAVATAAVATALLASACGTESGGTSTTAASSPVGKGGDVSPSVVASDASLRPCVDLGNANCAPVGTTGAGGQGTMRCWRDGSWAKGIYSSNRWFLMTLGDGREGYVHSSFVTQQAQVPNCDTQPYVKAADFAIAQIGNVDASPTTTAAYTAADWGVMDTVNGQRLGEWSGDCAKLTESSFTEGAGAGYETGNAIDQWHKFQRDGLARSASIMPRYGDPVFYDIAAPYGHTAIYVGGTTVVTTRGMDGDHKKVERQDMHFFANYLGWARV